MIRGESYSVPFHSPACSISRPGLPASEMEQCSFHRVHEGIPLLLIRKINDTF